MLRLVASVLHTASSLQDCNLLHGATAARDTQLTHRGSYFHPTNASRPLRCTFSDHLAQTSQLQLGAFCAADAWRRARPALRACHKPLLTESRPAMRCRTAAQLLFCVLAKALTPPSLVRRRRAPIVYSDEPPLPPESTGDALPEPTAEEFDDLSLWLIFVYAIRLVFL